MSGFSVRRLGGLVYKESLQVLRDPAAILVTFGLRNMWRVGAAMNPKTVTTGQVKTRVCRRGNPATVSHQCVKRSSSVPVPCRKS